MLAPTPGEVESLLQKGLEFKFRAGGFGKRFKGQRPAHESGSRPLARIQPVMVLAL